MNLPQACPGFVKHAGWLRVASAKIVAKYLYAWPSTWRSVLASNVPFNSLNIFMLGASVVNVKKLLQKRISNHRKYQYAAFSGLAAVGTFACYGKPDA